MCIDISKIARKSTAKNCIYTSRICKDRYGKYIRALPNLLTKFVT